MKVLLVASIAFACLSAHAVGIKRLTTTTCSDVDSNLVLEVKWDSSVSPFGPVSLNLRGKEVVQGVLMSFEENGINFSKQIVGEIFSVFIESEKKFETVLEEGEQEHNETALKCETKAKFRPYL